MKVWVLKEYKDARGYDGFQVFATEELARKEAARLERISNDWCFGVDLEEVEVQGWLEWCGED